MEKDNPAPEADGVKNTESEKHSLGALAGGRPVRKRGYHRALKRGESWALIKENMDSMLKELNKEMYLQDFYKISRFVESLPSPSAEPSETIIPFKGATYEKK